MTLARPEFALAAWLAGAAWVAVSARVHAVTRRDLAALLIPAAGIPLAVYGGFAALTSPGALLFDNLYPREQLEAGAGDVLGTSAPMTAGSFAELAGRLAVYAVGVAALLLVARMIGSGGARRTAGRRDRRRRRPGRARGARRAARAGPPRAPVRLRLDPGGGGGGRRPAGVAQPRPARRLGRRRPHRAGAGGARRRHRRPVLRRLLRALDGAAAGGLRDPLRRDPARLAPRPRARPRPGGPPHRGRRPRVPRPRGRGAGGLRRARPVRPASAAPAGRSPSAP